MTKKGIIALTVSLSATIVALIIAVSILAVSANTYMVQLDNTLNRCLYELTNNISSIEVDITKLIATNESKGQNAILNDIYNTCLVANTNISVLPIENNKISEVNSFINHLGGYCYSLIEKTRNDLKLNSTDLETIEELHTISLAMLYDVNEFISTMSFDYSIVKNVDYKNSSGSGFSNGLSNVSSSVSKIPTLIYDGPFADSVVNQEIKGLSNNIITTEEALSKMQTMFANSTEIKFVGETNGKFATYDYEVKMGYLTLNVQLTKRDGVVINITSYGNNKGNISLTTAECELAARDYARMLGFNQMYSVWSASSGLITYVNLAPIINSVIYYPDLVKVKIDNKTGDIIGLEATNYCYNHVSRNLKTANLTLNQAQEKISPLLTVVEKNNCVIAKPYGGEVFAYEFICVWKEYTYYVYIDADSGEEVNIFRVVETNNGGMVF